MNKAPLKSCIKATQIIEKKLQAKLNLKEQLELRFHLIFCHACSNYYKQSILINKAFNKLIKNSNSTFPSKEEEALKEKILKKLSE